MDENQLLGLMVLALYMLVVFAPFLLLAVLLFKKNKEFHDKVLLAWLVVSAANSFIEFIKITEPPDSIPFLIDLNKALLLSNLFFFYGYFKSLVQSEFKWRSGLTWALLPLLVWIAACLANWFSQWLFFKDDYAYHSMILEYEEFTGWLEALFIAGMICIVFWVWSKLREMMKLRDNATLSKRAGNLKKILLIFVSIYFLVVGWEYGLSKVLNSKNSRQVWVTFLLWSVVGLLVALGFFLIKQKSLFKKTKPFMQSNEAIGKVFQTIVDLMVTDKPYLNPGLTISMLAVSLEETPQKVSEAIKIKTDQSFYSFINKYRVDEAKNLLKDSTYSSYSIVSVGLESGFNSKATFNRVFKNETGMTPSAYCSKVKTLKGID
ncbi:MAG: helix-turn-helix domain-containing protein [Bacteroidota bacterium]